MLIAGLGALPQDPTPGFSTTRQVRYLFRCLSKPNSTRMTYPFLLGSKEAPIGVDIENSIIYQEGVALDGWSCEYAARHGRSNRGREAGSQRPSYEILAKSFRLIDDVPRKNRLGVDQSYDIRGMQMWGEWTRNHGQKWTRQHRTMWNG